MQQALRDLFSIIEQQLYQPINQAIIGMGWLNRLFDFLNIILSKIFTMFNDASTETATIFLSSSSIAAVISTIIFIYCLIWFIRAFKFAFRILKSSIEITPATGSSKEWRKQWKRKK